jgi:uncharacterized protein (TIGR02284 family)
MSKALQTGRGVQMSEGYSLVKTVVQVLHDGQKGFADLAEKLKRPDLREFFLAESATRTKFATELEAELAHVKGDTKDIGGTATGAIHRTWADLKASLGGGDHALLETAEQGEDAAKKAYQEALEAKDLPSTAIREMIQHQQAHVLASHDKVKAFRDSTAS